MSDYGSDAALDASSDVRVVDSGLTRLDGPALVAQDVAEALRTPRGSLPWDRDAGSDLLLLLHAAVVRDEVAEAEIRRVAIADPRVDAATVSVSREGEGEGGYRLSFHVLGSAEHKEIPISV